MTLDISPDQPELISEFLTLAKCLAGGEIKEPELTVAIKQLPALTYKQLDSLAEYAQAQAHKNPRFSWAVARVGDVSAVTNQSDLLLQAKAAWYLGRAANAFFQPRLATKALQRARDGFVKLAEREWLAACDWQENALPWARPNLQQCLTKLEEALKIISSPNSLLAHFQPDCRLTLAYTQALLGQPEDAHNNLDICLETYRENQDHLGIIRCYQLRGHIYFRQALFDSAVSILERGLALAKANAAPVEEALCLARFGDVYYKRQFGSADYLMAEAKILEAIKLFRQLDLSFWEALYKQGLSDIYISRGNISEAAEVLAHCLPIIRNFNLDAPLASILIAKGWLETIRANYPKGIADLEEATALAQRVGNRYLLGTCYMHLGELYLEIGSYQRSLHYLEESVEIFKVLRNSGRIAECCLRLARCWRAVGRTDRALSTLDQAETNAKMANQENIFPYLYIRQAESYFANDELDAAISVLRKAIHTALELKDKMGVALSHRLLGETLTLSGQLMEAVNHLETAGSTFLEMGLVAEQTACKVAWGNYYHKLGKPKLAYDEWQQATEMAKNIGPDVIWQAEAGLARLELDGGNLVKAVGHYRRVVTALNRLRQDMWQPTLAGFFLKRPISTLEDAIQLAVGVNSAEDVLFFIEASKAQVLANQFKQPVLSDTDVYSPDLSNLIGEIRWRDERLRGVKSGGDQLGLSDILKIQSELHQMVREYDSLRGRIERKQATSRRNILPNTMEFDLEGFRNAADKNFGDGWAALDYYLMEEEGLCILISSESFIVKRLGYPGGARFVLDSLDSLPAPGKWKRKNLARVGEWLLPDEILEILPNDKPLIIAPHRQLNYLPWSALPAGEQPLVGRSFPVIVPSLQSMAALMARPKKNNNPDKGLILAVSDFGGRHWPLPSVLDEVKSLMKLYPESEAMLNKEVTWSKFQNLANKSGFDDYDFLHFASHAFSDTVSGRLSGLALFDRDVWLDELKECGPFPGLVTLSACSGSKSHYFEGDEQIGLATTFLAAGARQVVASLWRIHDQEAASLMKLFYKNLSSGYPASYALAMAQRSFVQSDRENINWAGFRCTGLPK